MAYPVFQLGDKTKGDFSLYHFILKINGNEKNCKTSSGS